MNAQIIAIDKNTDVNPKAMGQIVFWALGGNVKLDALKQALAATGSTSVAPDEPSAKTALTRATNHVARAFKCEPHQRKQGSWVIVDRGDIEETGIDTKTLRQKVLTEAQVTPTGLDVQGAYEPELRQAFDEARAALAPTDIGNWLCAQLRKLGAVALRESGGFYFVPRDAVAGWQATARAVSKCSEHVIHSIPAMRSDDAVEAVLTAITSDTRAECAKIDEEIASGLGKRGAVNREDSVRVMAERLERYEELLGTRLEDLRGALEEARTSLAIAVLGNGNG